MNTLPVYAKAIGGAIVAAGGTAVAAASDGHVSLAEGITIVVAFVAALVGVAAVPNRERPSIDAERVKATSSESPDQ